MELNLYQQRSSCNGKSQGALALVWFPKEPTDGAQLFRV
jgi:hypothetical protein